MRPEDRYHRFVRWSGNDRYYTGCCPDIYFGGVCHRSREEDNYAVLSATVRVEIGHRSAKGDALPGPAVCATRDFEFAA